MYIPRPLHSGIYEELFTFASLEHFWHRHYFSWASWHSTLIVQGLCTHRCRVYRFSLTWKQNMYAGQRCDWAWVPYEQSHKVHGYHVCHGLTGKGKKKKNNVHNGHGFVLPSLSLSFFFFFFSSLLLPQSIHSTCVIPLKISQHHYLDFAPDVDSIHANRYLPCCNPATFHKL